jgi:Transposase DDE domain group 1
LARPAERVVAFYNQRGTAEQWIKEGKDAIKWTRLSCRSFAANAVRLRLRALAYNLGNFMRTLALPKAVAQWSLTSLREKLIKIGAKVVSHGRYVTFQLAEVAVSRQMFQQILSLIARLRAPAFKCNGQRRRRGALMKANQRVPAPPGRRTHRFGSTWRRSRGKLLLWMFYNQTIAFADAGIGKCRLRLHSRAFIYVVARIALAKQ